MQYINTNKLEKLKIANGNTYVVLDFDKTITSTESKDSWEICGELLGKEFKEKLNKYCDYYYPIEIDYKISKEEKEKHMIEWYSKDMELFYEYHLTKEKLEQAIKQCKDIFRKGAKEFLKKAKENNMPVIILSAGIGNVIEGILELNGCYYDNIHIISNFIKFDDNGDMIKFNDEMIHTLNKTIEGHLPSELDNEVKEKEYGILVGDLIYDINMIPKDKLENTVTIAFVSNDNNLEDYKQNFDVVFDKEDANFASI